MRKTYLVLVALSLSLAIGCNKSYKCSATGDEKCPSDKWGQELMEYNALAAKYKAPEPNREDMLKMKGLLKDLQEQGPAMIVAQGIPADWTLDMQRGVFTKPKAMPTPTTTLVPPIKPVTPVK